MELFDTRTWPSSIRIHETMDEGDPNQYQEVNIKEKNSLEKV